MNILHTLHHVSRDRNLPLLIIGGHAVAASGFRRSTADLDIAVRKEHRATWREIMESMGYTLFSDQLTFAQFHPPQPWEWPVDLMFLSEETFRKLASEAVETVILGVQARILRPSISLL